MKDKSQHMAETIQHFNEIKNNLSENVCKT